VKKNLNLHKTELVSSLLVTLSGYANDNLKWAFLINLESQLTSRSIIVKTSVVSHLFGFLISNVISTFLDINTSQLYAC